MSLESEEKIKELEASLAARDALFARLREAYIDLDAAAPLRELGQASSFINHEIKNYMMVISGYATLLLRSKTLSDKERDMVENISQSAAKLQEFSASVMETARAGDKRGRVEEIDLRDLLRSCVDANFADTASRISIHGDAREFAAAIVNGDPEKLSRAFACAIKNSLEAGARTVDVRVYVRNYIALIAIDDDGEGCDSETFQNLSKTFFTSKHGADGMGLGLCAIRSIVQAHGGNVSVYSKNLLPGGARGLSLQIMLPSSKRVASPVSSREIALVRDGFGSVAGVLKILRKLKVVPRSVNGVKNVSLSEGAPLLDTVVLAAPSQAREIASAHTQTSMDGGGASIKALMIEEDDRGILFVTDMDTGDKELFTEEYVARCIG